MYETIADEFDGDRTTETLHTPAPEGALVTHITAAREQFGVAVGSYPRKDDTPAPPPFYQRLYRAMLTRAIAMPLVVLPVALAITLGAALFYDNLPRELAPREDRGVGFVPLTAPQGSTVPHSDLAARQVEEILQPMVDSGEIETVFTFTGWGGRAWRSFVVFRLAPWEDRDRPVSAVTAEIAPQASHFSTVVPRSSTNRVSGEPHSEHVTNDSTYSSRASATRDCLKSPVKRARPRSSMLALVPSSDWRNLRRWFSSRFSRSMVAWKFS